MTDLVEKVAEAIKAEASMNYGHTETDLARAALAVAYDDLAEPTEAMRDAGEWAPPDLTATWQAMLAAKRKEALGDE